MDYQSITTARTKCMLPVEIRNGLLAVLTCSLLVIACYYWIDKPVVFWVNQHHINSFILLKWLTYIPNIFIFLCLIAYPFLIFRFYYKRWNFFEQVLLAISLSLTISYFFRGLLKFVFGRYWPATWTHNNPSLLHDNIYGFTWFHRGIAYESFPSGHMITTLAVMGMIWFLFPRWRWLVVLVSLLVAIGLLGMEYHFVSDVIAGGVIGGLVAYYTAGMMGSMRMIKEFKATHNNPDYLKEYKEIEMGLNTSLPKEPDEWWKKMKSRRNSDQQK